MKQIKFKTLFILLILIINSNCYSINNQNFIDSLATISPTEQINRLTKYSNQLKDSYPEIA
nr:hypothetical protein [Bacteroidales bacterium]